MTQLTVVSRNAVALRDLPPAERDVVVRLATTQDRLAEASTADLVTGLEWIFRTRQQRDKGAHELVGDVQLYLASLEGCSQRAWRVVLDALKAGRLDENDDGRWVPTIPQLVKALERIDVPERVRKAQLEKQAEHYHRRREEEERARKDPLALERSRNLYARYVREQEERKARERQEEEARLLRHRASAQRALEQLQARREAVQQEAVDG